MSEYEKKDVPADRVEEAARYQASLRLKKQGEYTLEDYYAWAEDQRIELIDGIVYDMGAPSIRHQDGAGEIYVQLKNYIKKKGGPCRAFISPINVQLDCDDKTMVQPDVLIVCDPSKLTDKCIVGAPDFILEVMSRSSHVRDMVVKLQKYKAAGVKEYWLLDPAKEKLIVYEFAKGTEPVLYGMTGKVPVGIYQGDLEIDLDEIS